MTDVGVVDRFFAAYNQYLDSGFGLLRPEVAFLTSTLVVIDVTLALLFWTWSAGEDILARLVRKTLYVGFFAFLIGNFQRLSTIVLESFSGLGLKAAGGGLSAADFLRPGRVAAAGIDAAKPLLEAAAELSGFPAFFENIVQIVVLLIAWVLIVAAFFIISVQVFVTLVEFKLTSLAGFVLVPFGLFGRTAFLAERVLGNVIAAGVKVLVLAIVVGIGSGLFEQLTGAISADQPTLETVLALSLAAVTLLGLSIFGPGIASGLVSGAPQLGAGAAVGTGLAVGGMAMAGAGAAQLAVGAGSSLAGAAAGAGRRVAAGGGSDDLRPPPSNPSGSPGPGPDGGGSPGPATAPQTAKASADQAPGGQARGDRAQAGQRQGEAGAAAGGADPTTPPAWAREMRRDQTLAQGTGLVLHAVASSDDHSAGASPSLSEDRS